jgi:hypothetical protein
MAMKAPCFLTGICAITASIQVLEPARGPLLEQ